MVTYFCLYFIHFIQFADFLYFFVPASLWEDTLTVKKIQETAADLRRKRRKDLGQGQGTVFKTSYVIIMN